MFGLSLSFLSISSFIVIICFPLSQLLSEIPLPSKPFLNYLAFCDAAEAPIADYWYVYEIESVFTLHIEEGA